MYRVLTSILMHKLSNSLSFTDRKLMVVMVVTIRVSVKKYCIMFNGERTNVHDKKSWVQPTDRLKARIRAQIQKDRYTISNVIDCTTSY